MKDRVEDVYGIPTLLIYIPHLGSGVTLHVIGRALHEQRRSASTSHACMSADGDAWDESPFTARLDDVDRTSGMGVCGAPY